MKTNPDFMWDFYTIKHVPYDLRTSKTLYLPTINATLSDLNSLIFRGSLLWNNLPTCLRSPKAYLMSKRIYTVHAHAQCAVDNMPISRF